MPTTLSIRIANDDPTPNGNAAVLSISGANNSPNQATWTASDHAYQITLPAAVWNPPAGGSLSFTLAQGQTSGIYTLKPNAPTGTQSYSIASTTGDVPPKV